MPKKILLACGILSSLLYVGIDALAAIRFGNYHSYASQAISELGARGAPTKPMVDPLFIAYDMLILAFGVGVWASANGRRALRLIGWLVIGIAAVGLVTPPMNLRGTGSISADMPHIVLTGVLVLLILAAIASGASLYGRRWRTYSFATLVTLLISGGLTGLDASRLAAHEPTPWLGLLERINIGAYLLWMLVLAIALWREAAAQSNKAAKGRGRVLPMRGAA